MTDTTTDIAIVDSQLTPNPKGVKAYSSVTGDDKATKVMVFNAVTNAESLGDKLGEVLTIQNIVIAPVELESEATGKLEVQPRVTLIDANGKGYYATSGGIYDGVNQLRTIFGEPSPDNDDWPLNLYVEEIKTSKGRKMFQIRLDTSV